MRRQDELLALYPGRDVLTRKYILSQVEGLSMTFDSDELLEFLQGELGDDDPVIRHQALFTMTRFLPGYIRKRYGLSANTMGVWSTYEQNRDQIQKLMEETKELPAKAQQRRSAYLYKAGPLADALLHFVGRAAGSQQSAARLALSQMPLKSVSSHLLDVCRKEGTTFETLLPFALVSQGEDQHRALLELIINHMDVEPDLCLLVCVLPPELAFRSILQIAIRTSRQGRMNLVLALARVGQIDHRAALERLRKFGEGWVEVYSLRAMESLGSAEYLPDVIGAYRSASNEFIRVQAVRAAGGFQDQNAIQFCLDALVKAAEPVKAQALESLVRLRCPIDTLSRAAAPLLESTSLRARVNAILATTSAREEAPKQLMELLLSGDAMARLEAAYVLGYMQNRKSLSYLTTLATYDPNNNVKLQAIKSLSKYPARHALPNLLPLLKSRDARTALTASRVLGRFDGEEAASVCEILVREVDRSRSKFERALLYRTIGSLAGRSEFPHSRETLRKGLECDDVKVVTGAIEGWNLQGGVPDAADVQILERLSHGGDRRAAPRALMGRLFAGDLDALDGLAAIIRSGNPRDSAPAVETVLELGLLVGEEGTGFRYPALREALDRTVDADEFAGFSQSGEVTRSAHEWARAPQEEAEDVAGEEFRVSRSLRKTSTVPTAPRAQPSVDEQFSAAIPILAKGDAEADEGVQKLRQHLQKPQVRRDAQSPNFNERLQKLTYLIGSLEAPTWIESLWRYKMLVIPAGALVMIFAVILIGAFGRLGEDKVVEKPPFSVEYVWGQVRLEGAENIMRAGEEVRIGAVIGTRPGEKVRLITRSGNKLTIFGGSTLTVNAIKGTSPDLSVDVTKGHYLLEFAEKGRVDLECGRFKIGGDSVVASLEPYRDKFSLIVDAGPVTFEEIGSGVEDLVSGDLRVLE